MTVEIDIKRTTTIVTINRPDVRNAVDRPTADALEAAFLAFDADPQQRVAVLTGASGTFCAGADLKGVADGRGNRVLPVSSAPGPMGPTRLELSKPVIAAVEGYAVAGGLELALWCDLRIAGEGAIFGVACRRWGVPLIDGGTVRLPRLIGQSRALDMILTGRDVTAEEAFAMGLANRLVKRGTSLDAALQLAQELAVLPQRCLRSDRQSALDQWSLDGTSALSREYELGFETIMSGETLEGAARFVAGAGRHGAKLHDASEA
ncbi:MAG: crotonase/enoyl-CoA hydratase family protein [Actinomycetota bacterium]